MTVDLSQRDLTVRPQDDFFRYLHGAWLDNVQFDPDKSSVGSFITLRDEAEQKVHAIVKEQSSADLSTDEGKIAALYQSFMAEERVEQLGAQPIAPLLEQIAKITDPSSLANYLGMAMRGGYGQLFSLAEEADPGEENRYVFFLIQSGLGLPDEEYYRLAEHCDTLAKYREHVSKMLGLAGLADPDGQAELVVEVEKRIAALHWDKVRCRDLVALFNPTSLSSLLAESPGFAWRTFLAAAHIPEDKLSYLVNAQPSFFAGLSKLCQEIPAAHWRSWASWHLVSAAAPYLSADFVAENFAFYGKTLSGTEELRPRWKRAVSFVESAVGEAVGRMYVARHFKPEAKAAMDNLVANLIAAYRNSIAKLDWMTEETKNQALAKLAGFRPKIGYRKNWRDYSALIVGDDLVANVLSRNAFEFDYTISRILSPVDPDDWAMLPQTVNAYYSSLRNEIVFPAAILQPPFFDLSADEPVNYGAIGAVIGHEIGHGFDDKGSATDAEGKIRNWWTPQDSAAFQELTGRLVEQYDGLTSEGIAGQVNGKLTLGENIGDLGGAGIAYQAWLLSGGNPTGEKIDGFTPAQRFFLGYCAIWRTKRRPEMAKMLLSVDPHSPAEFRVNKVLPNIDAFHEAFNTTQGDGMWLDPKERVHIW